MAKGRLGDEDFDRGILWAAARLVEFHDQPTIAGVLLRESGANLSLADDVDMPFLTQAAGTHPGKDSRL